MVLPMLPAGELPIVLHECSEQGDPRFARRLPSVVASVSAVLQVTAPLCTSLTKRFDPRFCLADAWPLCFGHVGQGATLI